MTVLAATFGTFMAVLIAIEIFANIVLYLRHDVIHVKLVMATAMMAIAPMVSDSLGALNLLANRAARGTDVNHRGTVSIGSPP